MSAPIWQYIVLLIIFISGFVLSSLGMITTKGGEVLKETIKKATPGLFVVKMLVAIFGMYLSYSLLAFSGFAMVPVVLVVLHWAMIIRNVAKSTSKQDKEVSFDYKAYTFGTVFAACLLVLTICYGINYL